MKLEKLLGSKTKVDILKYLVFKRQGISIRALENELTWSFPAIKKQVDLLCDADILKIDKTGNGWSICLESKSQEIIRKIFLFSIESALNDLITKNQSYIFSTFYGRIFGKPLDMDIDLVIVYESVGKEFISQIKKEIEEVFRDYFIDIIGVVFMSKDDYHKRYRLADKFVLNLIRHNK